MKKRNLCLCQKTEPPKTKPLTVSEYRAKVQEKLRALIPTKKGKV